MLKILKVYLPSGLKFNIRKLYMYMSTACTLFNQKNDSFHNRIINFFLSFLSFFFVPYTVFDLKWGSVYKTDFIKWSSLFFFFVRRADPGIFPPGGGGLRSTRDVINYIYLVTERFAPIDEYLHFSTSSQVKLGLLIRSALHKRRAERIRNSLTWEDVYKLANDSCKNFNT